MDASLFPTGICDSLRSPSPFCSIISASIETSIEIFRLTRGRLHCHVSGESNPLLASSVTAAKRMVTNDQCFLFDYEPKPCMSSEVPCPELGGGPLAITRKTSRSNEIQNSNLRRVASAVTSLPTPKMADSPFLKALGTSTIQTSPGRKQESWPKGQLKTGNGTCAKTKLAILNKMQEGKTALIKKDGGEILIAIELDKPLPEARR